MDVSLIHIRRIIWIGEYSVSHPIALCEGNRDIPFFLPINEDDDMTLHGIIPAKNVWEKNKSPTVEGPISIELSYVSFGIYRIKESC